ncbi:probable microtubule-binding protein TANGLED [Actinidia eriantha]|uniref:probable microtubule-binding protein TANGLED n=1 Tax=Actinidia eriantha TaxID=165200 RepID=UPI00258561A0|nr:probable microtubule-binding protein TANGLED [Actinidia eriantha]
MVARTPPKLRKMVVPLNPTLLRETVNKVDKCMARLQELQYTVAGGKKVISGVSLSPRSTRGYMRTSLRCKQESLRIKSGNHTRKSPPGKLPTHTEEWQRMSLPAMLVGETVGEILQASQFAREIVASVHSKAKKQPPSDDPKTPVTQRRKQRLNPENSELYSRRKREKQAKSQSTRPKSHSPSLQRARSRINFKPCERESTSYLANRVSPRNRPWAKKTVLFPNPLFHSSPTSNHHKFFRTKSPVIARNRQTPHKFLIKAKSPPPPPRFAPAKFSVRIRSPPLTKSPKLAKLRRSFSPSRIANRLVSPLKNRKSVMKSDGGGGIMSGLKQRPISTPMQFSARRI